MNAEAIGPFIDGIMNSWMSKSQSVSYHKVDGQASTSMTEENINTFKKRVVGQPLQNWPGCGLDSFTFANKKQQLTAANRNTHSNDLPMKLP